MSESSRSEVSHDPPVWRPTDENVALCIEAIRGNSVPVDLLFFPEARICVVHGIRHHAAFANAAQVVDLCRTFPEFARARNARLIMSNVIPEMSVPSSIPYCIWYPDVATEDTYRELARKYPDMRYHVGRACAVAGYTELYRELNLLPDISIAEEARENINNGHDIFLDIVQASTRYAVMDDYTRTVNLVNPRAGVFLNGDTAVCSSLSLRDAFESGFQWHNSSYDLRGHFDITEDRGVGEHEVGPIPPPLRENEVQWLYKPLPRDLPLVNKDLLILMAAYEGNVDRYARLRRPHLHYAEFFCIIRGIYHHTTFAKWWAEELENENNDQAERRIGRPNSNLIWRAITARFIMCNDLSLVTAAKRALLPYLIWYPLRPRPETLAELVLRRPEMLLPVAHACIAADYQNVYDELDVTPHPALLEEAKHSGNPYYLSSNPNLERTGPLGSGPLPGESRKIAPPRTKNQLAPGSMALPVLICSLTACPAEYTVVAR